MEIPIRTQLVQAATGLLFGGAFGLFWDVLRLFRRRMSRLPGNALGLAGLLTISFFAFLAGRRIGAGMRQIADFDILVDTDRAADVRVIMEGMGFPAEEYGRVHHDLYSRSLFYVFEMHRMLFPPFSDRNKYKYYKDVKNRLLSGPGTCEFRFSPEDFYIYMLAHESKRFDAAGIGVKANLDIYVYCRRFGAELNREYISGELEKLGLTAFERESRELTVALFGKGDVSSDGLEILERHIFSGSFGSEETRVAHAIDVLGGGFQGKLRYALKRLGASRDLIESEYLFFSSHRALTPLLYPYRLI